jgi:hypothetical protein
VLLIVSAGVTFMVLSATRRQRQAAIVAPDDNTPLGDTDQVSGEQGSDDPPGERGGEHEGRRVVPESERLANRRR